MKKILTCLVLACLFWNGAQAADKPAEPFTLSSPNFKDDDVLPKTAWGSMKESQYCIGENKSPALSWSNAPEATKSYAITLTDSEGRNGLSVVHWVAYGIAPSVTGFAEGEVANPSDKYVGGKGTRGLTSYTGPCPPPNSWHHYTFVIIATDLDPKALDPGMTKEELLAKLNGHTLSAAGLIGRARTPAK